MKTIIVYYNELHLFFPEDYAKLKGLKNGYKIQSQKEFLQILEGHAEYQIHKIKMLIESKKT